MDKEKILTGGHGVGKAVRSLLSQGGNHMLLNEWQPYLAFTREFSS